MNKIGLLLLAVVLVPFALSANGGQESESTEPAKTGLVWWDHFKPLVSLHESIWAEYTKTTGIEVDYTQYNPAKLTEALQLAYRSNQSPDVFPNVMGVADSNLYHEGWYAPLTISQDNLPDVVRENLFEGYTIHNGKIYSFPLFSGLNHPASTWFNTDLVSAAGYSTDDIPVNYDGIRKLAKDIVESSGGEVYGIILPLKFFNRINTTIDDLAMAAGAPGPIDWATGEYMYDSDYYLQVFDFLTSFKEDGTIHPGSINFDMRQARERWAAGEAALLFDGSWNIGVVVGSFPAMIDLTGVSSLPTPDGGDEYLITRGPATGTFWISNQSDYSEEATDILMKLTTEEYYIKLAERMDQPPLDLSAVDKANVHDTYKKVISYFAEEMGYAPDPALRNRNISLVYSAMKDIHPNPAEILQGYYGDAVDNYENELRKYNDKVTRERMNAIEKVKAEGYDVSLDDWIFSNWTKGKSYTSEMYD